MIALALALSLVPCSRPVIEPQAGHGLFTHIRRLPDICLPEVGVVPPVEPLVPIALTELPPFVPALPAEGLWALPYVEPYCNCALEVPLEGTEGGFYGAIGGYPIGGGGGGFYVPATPVVTAPVPEGPIVGYLVLGGLGLLGFTRKRT